MPLLEGHAPGPAAMATVVNVAHQGTKHASGLLRRLFRDFDGSIAMRLWDRTMLCLGNAVDCTLNATAASKD